MEFTVYLVRKGGPAPKVSKAEAAKMAAQRATRCRVQRPEFVEFLTSGGFYAMPVMPGDVVNDPAKFALCGPDHPEYNAPKTKTWAKVGAWPVPVGSMGRAKTRAAMTGDDPEAARSAAESIRLWAKSWCSDMIDADHIGIVVVKSGD